MARQSLEGGNLEIVQQADTVVRASQWFGWVIAESLVNVKQPLTMPQWRVLVLSSNGDCNVTAVADDLRVHLSNATRMCDRLVEAGLIERRRDEHDRRNVNLHLTRAGRRLFESAMGYRRDWILRALNLMAVEDRAALDRTLSRFVDAATAARDGDAARVPD